MILSTLLLLACAVSQDPTPEAPWPPAPPLEVPIEEATGLPPSVAAEPLAGGRWRVSFTFRSNRSAETVHLAGTFNGWSDTATPLERGGDGRWRASLELAGGRHLYKFVLDGQTWMADPANPEGVDDNHQGLNSVLELGSLSSLSPEEAARNDDSVVALALEHDPALSLYRQPLPDGSWLLRFRTLAGDVETVELAVRGRAPVQMERAATLERFDYWAARIPGSDETLEYTFVFTCGELFASLARTFRLGPGEVEPFRTPAWAKQATWYQIFPDRFRNGSTENDPDPVRPWTSEWYTPSKWEVQGSRTFWRFSVFRRLYGGDLQGVREKLDHLVDLGVTAIYFNPLFQASTPHKYDATSFVHIDDLFGYPGGFAAAEAAEDLLDPSTWTWTPSDKLFLELVAEAHERGLRVIVDGVFNHVGVHHTAFRDVREKGRKSRFADWFDVRSWEPFEYAGWAGFGELPVFKKAPQGFACHEVEEHIFAITRRWMDPDGDGDPSDGIDGWRLDVPNEVPMPFWARWRRQVKSVNPEAYITGEIWQRADAWLDGRHFDAVMNYPFASATVAWIGHDERKIGVSELDRRLAELRLAYPAEATFAMQNLLDSHDTDRLVSMFKNPDREYDRRNREQDTPGYDGSKPDELHYRRARLAALLQATYVGAPMIYYGDEMGMWGADDPANRRPMLWKDLEPYDEPRENRVMAEHLEHYRTVFGLRRAHRALRLGSFRTLAVDDERDVWVFAREDDAEMLIVALNASQREQRVEIPELGEGFEPLYGSGPLDGRQRIPAIDGRVWVLRK